MSFNYGRIARGVVAVVVAVALLWVAMGIVADYRQAKDLQKAKAAAKAAAQSEPETDTETATSDLLHPDVTSEPATSGTKPGAVPAPKGSTVVVLVDGVNLRVEPDTKAKVIRGLKKGDELILVATEGDYYKVEYAKGKTGFVSSKPHFTKVVE